MLSAPAMTSIAAARKASTAARATAAETSNAQAALDAATGTIKVLDSQIKTNRGLLNAELQKSPPNAAVVSIKAAQRTRSRR